MARILVIDDDQATLDLVQAFLERAHDVTTATNGEQGIEMCQKDRPDILITDIFMPFKDGLEIVREAQVACPEAKIIAITGQGREGAGSYLRLAEDMGAAGTLSKPFTSEQLNRLIEDILD